jgi:hypothetical protein
MFGGSTRKKETEIAPPHYPADPRGAEWSFALEGWHFLPVGRRRDRNESRQTDFTNRQRTAPSRRVS